MLQNYLKIKNGIPAEVQLIAVSKGQDVGRIREFVEQTQHFALGENYAQELAEKAAQLKDLPIAWHFLGHLQSNKITKIVNLCAEIHALDSLKHASLIASTAKAAGKTPYPVYLAVNNGEEEQKSGVDLRAAEDFAHELAKQAAGDLLLRGIMCVPPARYSDTEFAQSNKIPDLYLQLAALAKKIGQGKLSLGMTNDLKLAIAAGSSCVRIGTAIFGERNK